jgi:hypothetical protein
LKKIKIKGSITKKINEIDKQKPLNKKKVKKILLYYKKIQK